MDDEQMQDDGQPRVVVIDGVERPDVHPGDTADLRVMEYVHIELDAEPDVARITAALGDDRGVGCSQQPDGVWIVEAPAGTDPAKLAAAARTAAAEPAPTPLERLARATGLPMDELTAALAEAQAAPGA